LLEINFSSNILHVYESLTMKELIFQRVN